MKALSMPTSSPSRPESFPPPLMSFLRSNTGSRSRGRSRSSSLFYMRRRRSASAAIETTQEPSSPKVTCMGQVRDTTKSGAKTPGSAAVKRRPKKILFCGSFPLKFQRQKGAFRGALCKWGLFFRVHSSNQKKAERSEFCGTEHENLGDGAQEGKTDFLDDSSSPPKGIAILTRCRSAPYRCSSLGGRFWGSPFAENEVKSRELQKPTCENAVRGSRIGRESGEGLENSGNYSEALKGVGGGVGAVHPLLLTRCKSEPAKRGERLHPEASFWKQRRGAVEPCSWHSS